METLLYFTACAALVLTLYATRYGHALPLAGAVAALYAGAGAALHWAYGLTTDTAITVVAALVISTLSVVGAFSKAFDDTMAQRVILAGTSLAGIGVAVYCVRNLDIPLAMDTLVDFTALHGLETARKFWLKNKQETI